MRSRTMKPGTKPSALLTALLVAACGGGGDSNSPIGNQTPVANAGADRVTKGSAVVALNGSTSSNADGDTLTYR